MAYNSIHNLTNIYNHYLANYAPKGSTPYDSHKKSELRGVYNSIVKMNKESPLYILDNSSDAHEFAVGMKENARELRNTIASLGGLDEEELLNKKAAFSGDESVVSATYIGSASEEGSTPSFEIEVKELASGQINRGKELVPSDPVELEPGTYSFDVNIDELNYEFQFGIKSNDTNRDLQERLNRLINNANVGITAELVSTDGRTAMKLSSAVTGLKGDIEQIFTISDDKTSKTSGVVDYLGIGRTEQKPTNARFILNGQERTTTSNHFTVERAYEIHLNGLSEEGVATSVGLKTDVESLTENVNELVRGYNNFLKAAFEYADSQPKSNRLMREVSGISQVYAKGLTTAGLHLNMDGTLEVDADALKNVAMSDNAAEELSSIKDFTNSLLRKTGEVSLNPMNYVNRTVVAYKNPGHNFATPYITSAYSGMMFNSYC